MCDCFSRRTNQPKGSPSTWLVWPCSHLLILYLACLSRLIMMRSLLLSSPTVCDCWSLFLCWFGSLLFSILFVLNKDDLIGGKNGVWPWRISCTDNLESFSCWSFLQLQEFLKLYGATATDWVCRWFDDVHDMLQIRDGFYLWVNESELDHVLRRLAGCPNVYCHSTDMLRKWS